MGMQFVVFSSKRSTHHAFIEGLLKGRGYVYKNNCFLKKGGKVSSKKIISEGNKSILVASFEQGFSLSNMNNKTIYESLDMDVTKAKKIVYLRDPLNTAASTYSIYKKVEKYEMDFVKRNLEHYCSIYNELDKLSDFLFIYANKFWFDASYRNEVLENIGLRDSLTSYDSEQSYFGGGGNSFFDNKENVSPDDLSSRFLRFKDDNVFYDLVVKYGLKSKAEYLAERFEDSQMVANIKELV